MVTAIVHNKSSKELKGMETIIKDLAAFMSEDNWNYMFTVSSDEAVCEALARDLLDITCFDLTDGSVEQVSNIRRSHKHCSILLIADDSISPMEYVRPDILASGLMLRPLTPQTVEDSLRSVIASYLDEANIHSEVFVFENKDGQIRIPYDRIIFFEATQKRIQVRLKNDCYVMTGTLDELEASLPDNFVRCHRSFIVNKQYVSNVRFSENTLYLAFDMNIPLSRTYKDKFKR